MNRWPQEQKAPGAGVPGCRQVSREGRQAQARRQKARGHCRHEGARSGAHGSVLGGWQQEDWRDHLRHLWPHAQQARRHGVSFHARVVCRQYTTAQSCFMCLFFAGSVSSLGTFCECEEGFKCITIPRTLSSYFFFSADYCIFNGSFFSSICCSYVETAHSKEGTAVQLNVRGKLIPAQVLT